MYIYIYSIFMIYRERVKERDRERELAVRWHNKGEDRKRSQKRGLFFFMTTNLLIFKKPVAHTGVSSALKEAAEICTYCTWIFFDSRVLQATWQETSRHSSNLNMEWVLHDQKLFLIFRVWEWYVSYVRTHLFFRHKC